jgi:hypothetical protein
MSRISLAYHSRSAICLRRKLQRGILCATLATVLMGCGLTRVSTGPGRSPEWKIASIPDTMCHASCTLLNPTCYDVAPATPDLTVSEIDIGSARLGQATDADVLKQAIQQQGSVKGRVVGNVRSSIKVNYCPPPLNIVGASTNLRVDTDLRFTTRGFKFGKPDVYRGKQHNNQLPIIDYSGWRILGHSTAIQRCRPTSVEKRCGSSGEVSS